MKCYICGLDYGKDENAGIGVKLVVYEKKRGIFSKRWRIVRRNKKYLICRKCSDTMIGLIRNYRRKSR